MAFEVGQEKRRQLETKLSDETEQKEPSTALEKEVWMVWEVFPSISSIKDAVW